MSKRQSMRQRKHRVAYDESLNWSDFEDLHDERMADQRRLLPRRSIPASTTTETKDCGIKGSAALVDKATASLKKPAVDRHPLPNHRSVNHPTAVVTRRTSLRRKVPPREQRSTLERLNYDESIDWSDYEGADCLIWYNEMGSSAEIPAKQLRVLDALTDEVLDLRVKVPERTVVAVDDNKKIVYEFLLTARQSGIAGADLGAFLTFVGGAKVANTANVEHYQLEPKRTFPVNAGALPLGVYGPLQSTDTKPAHIFDNKDFVLGNRASEYAFTASESNVIDITDDVNGLPHRAAKESICTYVNEVGYSKELEKNVRHKESDGTMCYYFVPSRAMQPGDEVELLADYTRVYERIRERKGYGRKNQLGVEKSDACRASRLRRNFGERARVERLWSDHMSAEQMEQAIEFVVEEMWVPLSRKAQSLKANHLKEHQWIGLARLLWLRDVILETIDEHEEAAKQLPRQHYIELLMSMDGTFLWDMLELKGGRAGVMPKKIRELILVEETCYRMHDELLMWCHPFDPGLWCKIASNLIAKLCIMSAMYFRFAGVPPEENDQHFLLAVYLDLTRRALEELEEGLDRIDSARGTKRKEAADESGLAFASGLHQDKLVTIRELSDSFYLENHSCPKAVQAAYVDGLGRGGGKRKIRAHAADNYLMFKQKGVVCAQEDLVELGSVARRSSSTHSDINRLWYIVWQIGYPVHVFATKYLRCGGQGFSAYRPEVLCDALGIDVRLLNFATKKGIIRANGRSHLTIPVTSLPKAVKDSPFRIGFCSPNERRIAPKKRAVLPGTERALRLTRSRLPPPIPLPQAPGIAPRKSPSTLWHNRPSTIIRKPTKVQCVPERRKAGLPPNPSAPVKLPEPEERSDRKRRTESPHRPESPAKCPRVVESSIESENESSLDTEEQDVADGQKESLWHALGTLFRFDSAMGSTKGA